MGYRFMHILGEGTPRRLPRSTAEEYAAARARILDGLRDLQPPLPDDQTERERMLGEVLIAMQKWRD